MFYSKAIRGLPGGWRAWRIMLQLTNRLSVTLTVLLAVLWAAALNAEAPGMPAGLAKNRVAGPLPTSVPWGAEIRARVPRFAPDRLLVKFRPGTAASEIGRLHRKNAAKPLHDIPGIGVHVLKVPKGSVRKKQAQYQANPNVEYAEPDYYRVLVIPDEGNDPGPLNCGAVEGREYFEEQWGLNNTGQEHTVSDPFLGPIQVTGTPDADIDAPEGWDITTGDPAVKIAILDTGIDCTSIEHTGKCVEQVSFVTEYSSNLDDIAQHGTHVAGIAAVNSNNGIGVAGVGWNSSIGNLKTCFEYDIDLYPPLGIFVTIGVCPVSSSAAAITYAADNNYHVINMSYGSDLVDENGDPAGIPSPPNVETDAITYAWSQGVVLVAAAGNAGNTTPVYPAAYTDVIAVAGTNRYDDKWGSSTFGNGWVSMMAPSENILSTTVVDSCVFFAEILGCTFDPNTEGCLTWNTGTSMASPHVAGAAALVWAHLFPGQSPESCTSPSGAPCNAVVRSHLEYGADTSGALGQNFLAWSQHGRLNLHGALAAFADNDADGIPDATDPDDDNDGLSDLDEINDIGTDPLVADTDGDGLLDGFEVNYRPNPPDTYTPGQDLNPLAADTDADGFNDGMEFAAGYDPLDVADFPVWGDINDDRLVDTVDVLLATRAIVGPDTLDSGALARGNVAPLLGGTPNPPLVDEFNLADLLLIMRKALGSISY